MSGCSITTDLEYWISNRSSEFGKYDIGDAKDITVHLAKYIAKSDIKLFMTGPVGKRQDNSYTANKKTYTVDSIKDFLNEDRIMTALNELDILFQILYVPPTIERYLDPNTFLVEEYSYERDPVIKNPKFIIRGVFKEGIPVEKEYLSY